MNKKPPFVVQTCLKKGLFFFKIKKQKDIQIYKDLFVQKN